MSVPLGRVSRAFLTNVLPLLFGSLFERNLALLDNFPAYFAAWPTGFSWRPLRSWRFNLVRSLVLLSQKHCPTEIWLTSKSFYISTEGPDPMKPILTTILLLLSLAYPAPAFQTVKPEEVEVNQKEQFDEIDSYLDQQVVEADRQRKESWQRDFSSVEAYEKSIEPWRQKLLEMLGGDVYRRSPLRPKEELVAELPTHKAWRVWFTAFENVRGYGILLVPNGEGPFPVLILVHGMSGTPEGLCGLTGGI